jgi:hypothetical protein
LYDLEYSQTAIAKELKLTCPTVTKVLKLNGLDTGAWWKKSAIDKSKGDRSKDWR